MTNTVWAVAAMCLSPLPAFSQGRDAKQPSELPIDTTLCEVTREPARFNGKVIRIRTRVSGSDEGSAFYDESCSALVMFALDSSSFNSRKSGRELRTLSAALKRYSLVIATVTGRFDHAAARQFGHQNMFDSRLMAQSISDVYARQIERSVFLEGTLKGSVVDRAGAFVVNAAAKLYRHGQKFVVASTHTDTSGTFSFPVLEPDTYDLVIDAPGFRSKRIKNISVANGSNVQLQPAKLELLGIVVDNPPGE